MKISFGPTGYGDIHAVNPREMIFVMVYVSFDMILGAYLIGNMTALIVKGSKTVRYRDRMTDLMNYMNRNRLGKDIRNQIKDHLRLQYESAYTDAAVLQDLPISIRAKVNKQKEKSAYVCKCSIFIKFHIPWDLESANLNSLNYVVSFLFSSIYDAIFGHC